jgi:hypothetical protein
MLVGSAATYAAFHHNPQEEFFDIETGRIHLDTAAPVFLSWLAVASLATFFVEIAIYGVAALLVRAIGRP